MTNMLSSGKKIIFVLALSFVAVSSAYAIGDGDIKTAPATNVTPTTATLNGSYTLGDARSIETMFLYGATPDIMQGDSSGKSLNTKLVRQPEQAAGDLSAPVSGLIPNTTYYYRAVLYYNDLTSTISPLPADSFKTGEAISQPSALPSNSVALNNGGLVTCAENCGYRDAIYMIQGIIDFVLYKLVLPIAAAMFMYAGFLFLTSGGDTGKRSKGKAIMLNVLIGLGIALAAWLVVNTVLNSLLSEQAKNEGGYNLLGE